MIDTSPSDQAKPPVVEGTLEAIENYGRLQAQLVRVYAHGDPELIASLMDAMRGMLVGALLQRDEATSNFRTLDGFMSAFFGRPDEHEDADVRKWASVERRQLVEARAEVEGLRGIISSARLACSPPPAFDCSTCEGEGSYQDDEVGPVPCSCTTSAGLAAFRAAWDANARDEAARQKLRIDEVIRREHGHEPEVPCTAACPSWF